MDMGTGKTLVTLMTACHRHVHNLPTAVNGLLVIAPNGVHQNWVSEELPKHWPDSVHWSGASYFSTKSGTQKQKAAVEELIKAEGLAVLCMSYDALLTDAGRKVAEKFLKARRCMMVLDESTRIKTPKAKRSMAAVALGRLAAIRRILTGTPVANSPFDVYAQIRFLDPDFWKKHGLHPFSVFKRAFGVIVPTKIGNRTFDQVVGYKDLDRLHAILSTISTRVTKEECLDLPPKLYSKVYFDLHSEQRKLYNQLRDEFMVELGGGAEITAPLAIVRLTRLQQLTSGYVTVDGEDAPRDVGDNRRLALLKEVCEDLESAIIWAKYQRDIDLISHAFEGECVVIDGRVPDAARGQLIRDFQSGKVRFFVGNPAAISEGVTLHRTSNVIYYSNSFRLDQRMQSEDRAHRIGQKNNVTIIDLVAKGTVDERIVAALRSKRNIAGEVTGDNLGEWI